MMYIGTSLGGCLRSIMAGEVSADEVMFIVTRTLAPTFEDYKLVVEQYHKFGNPYSRRSSQYDLNDFPLEGVLELAEKLWYDGKIHQPRVFCESSTYNHPVTYGDGLWLHVAPINRNTSPAVQTAWEQYKMLDTITK